MSRPVFLNSMPLSLLYVLDLDAIFRHGTICESSEDILHFSLVENYMHPGISRVIINNNEAIETSSGSKGGVMSRAE